MSLQTAQKVGSHMLEILATRVYHVWAVLIGAAGVVFSAGMIVEKIRTDKYVTKDVHTADLKTIDAKFETISVKLTGVQTSLDKVTEWIDKVRD